MLTTLNLWRNIFLSTPENETFSQFSLSLMVLKFSYKEFGYIVLDLIAKLFYFPFKCVEELAEKTIGKNGR